MRFLDLDSRAGGSCCPCSWRAGRCAMRTCAPRGAARRSRRASPRCRAARRGCVRPACSPSRCWPAPRSCSRWLRPAGACWRSAMPELERQDLVILLDRSASMRAHDIKPSRFSRATLEIRNFLHAQAGGHRSRRPRRVRRRVADPVVSDEGLDTVVVLSRLDRRRSADAPRHRHRRRAEERDGSGAARTIGRPARSSCSSPTARTTAQELNRQLNRLPHAKAFTCTASASVGRRRSPCPMLRPDGKRDAAARRSRGAS